MDHPNDIYFGLHNRYSLSEIGYTDSITVLKSHNIPQIYVYTKPSES